MKTIRPFFSIGGYCIIFIIKRESDERVAPVAGNGNRPAADALH